MRTKRRTEDKCCHESCCTISDAVCRHCGQEFCRVHIASHLKQHKRKNIPIDTARDSC